jgi:hypothetical protein
MAASFIAQPHAYAYDTVALSGVLVWWLSRGAVTWPRLGLAGLVYMGPWVLLSPWHLWFLYSPVIAGLVFVLARPIVEKDG